MLILDHNELTQVHPNFGVLVLLKKFFCSFNKLRFLPESIRNLSNLEKIRLVQNNISELPAGILHLWARKDAKDKGYHGGVLEELNLERNPLVLPSFTAFQTGGIDNAFEILERTLARRTNPQPPTSCLENGLPTNNFLENGLPITTKTGGTTTIAAISNVIDTHSHTTNNGAIIIMSGSGGSGLTTSDSLGSGNMNTIGTTNANSNNTTTTNGNGTNILSSNSSNISSNMNNKIANFLEASGGSMVLVDGTTGTTGGGTGGKQGPGITFDTHLCGINL